MPRQPAQGTRAAFVFTVSKTDEYERRGQAGHFRDEEAMSEGGMEIELGPADMWILLDRETVRLQLPPLQIAGVSEPLRVHLDFDAEMVDEMLLRLTALRAQMRPSPLKN
jgi:hypothetical protein